MRAAPLAIPLLAALAGCYSPTFQDGQFVCAVDTDCPDDFHCATCRGLCIHASEPLPRCADDDASVPLADLTTIATPDLTGPTGLPGCTALDGKRTSDDPGNQMVAFCHAAFSVPGVTTPANCNYQPGADGRSVDTGAVCALADNCALGWHVCVDADLAAAGLDMDQCTAVAGFYLSAQIGKQTLGFGQLYQCDTTDDGTLFGCGSPDGNTLTQCSVIGAIMSPPCLDGFSCSMLADATVTRGNANDPGGVLCCL